MLDRIIRRLGGYTEEDVESILNNEVGEVNITALARELLVGVDEDDRYFKDMTEEQKEAYLLEIYKISKNKSFLKMIKELTKVQIYKTINDAEKVEELNFGRATINGIRLIEQHIISLASQYEDTIKPKEVSDKYEVI